MDVEKLTKDLEEIRSRMEDMLDDESIISFPKVFNRIKDKLDEVLVGIETNQYDKEGDK